jgi:CBS domain-containing protein
MLVHQILSSKPSDAVLTIAEDATIAQAAMILSERRIGCLVVSGTGTRADGIISERDIVREVGRRGSACLSDPVGSIMTRRLVTCTRDETADNVLEIMTNNRFRHLPVVEHGHLIGLISIGDVVKARISELAMEKDALEGMIIGR